MKFKIRIAAMLLLCFNPWVITAVQCQANYHSKNIVFKPHELNVHDAVPDLPFAAMIQAPSKRSSLYRLNNKLVILDFMATTCIGCIEALPRLDSLQEKYKDQVQVLLVTYEDSTVVKRFLQKSKIGRSINLPFITGDTLLTQWFPHSYISHEVWITPQKKVLAITECEYVNDENIQLALSGAPVYWPVKKDINLVDKTEPLTGFSDRDSQYYQPPSASYYTVFSRWIKTRQVGFVYSKDSLQKTQRFYIANYPIIDMYRLAYDTIDLTTGHIVIDLPDKQSFIYTKGIGYLDAWNMANRYCYESVMPLAIDEPAMRRKVLSDLDNFFGLQTSFLMQQTDCLVLHDTTVVSTGSDNGPATVPTFSASLESLLYRIEHGTYGTPVLNESTANPETTVEISGKESLAELNIILRKHGLVISKMPRQVKMLVIQKHPVPGGLLYSN